MEEEVGLYDPDGLLAYAAYVRDALVQGASIEQKAGEGLSVGDGVLEFVLQFKIGALSLEGRMKVSVTSPLIMCRSQDSPLSMHFRARSRS
jgi:hypothetical protein